MSVLNILLLPERALIYSDSVAYYSDGTPGALGAPKAVVAPAGFVVATRGHAKLGERVKQALSECDSLSQAERTAHALMRDTERMRAIMSGQFRGLEITLVGMHAGSTRAVRFSLRPEDRSFTSEVLKPGLHVEPCPQGVQLVMPTNDYDARMVKLAMAQKTIADKYAFPMCLGGVLHRAEVSEAGAIQTIAALYPNYWELAQRFVDPCGEAVAAFTGHDRRIAA